MILFFGGLLLGILIGAMWILVVFREEIQFRRGLRRDFGLKDDS